MINTSILLLTISGVFLLGFFGNLFFKRTKISDLFILLLVGFLIGPIFHLIPDSILVLLKSFAPFFGAIALMLLLFQGGLYLNFYKVLKELSKATFFTILVFVLTIVFVTSFTYFVFNIPVLYGILIGAIIGGTSSAVVIPLVNGSSTDDDTKTLLTLESAITDSLCLVVAMVVINIIVSKTASIQSITSNLFAAYAISIVIGVFGGLFWIKILRDSKYAREFGYLLTLSFLIALYVLIEFANGNGAFGALIFGIVLGNSSEIIKIFKMNDFALDLEILKFQSEISLFIKSFFFIYLGVIINLAGINSKLIIIAVSIVILILIARYIVIKAFSKKSELFKESGNLIFSLHARGLAAAVLATYPIAIGIVNELTIIILPIVFLVILITNLTTTIYFFRAEKKLSEINTNS